MKKGCAWYLNNGKKGDITKWDTAGEAVTIVMGLLRAWLRAI
jgi:hypothetical protein